MKVRGPFSPRVRVTAPNGKKSRTKQSFKKDCDVNNIMKKYVKTGMVTHLSNKQPNYGYAPSIDFREAMEIVTSAKNGFDGLPSEVRRKFQNRPEEFLAFIENDDNRAEMIEMGLLEAPEGGTPAPPSDSATAPLAPSPADTQNEAKNGE